MYRYYRASHLRIVACVTLLWIATLTVPTPGWTWGATVHHYVAQNYSMHLPPTIDGLRTYDATVDLHVTDPDTRKGSVPNESPRHFIDVDAYPDFLTGTLSHSRAALETKYGAAVVLNNGVIPWAVGEVMANLTSQFQAQQWSAAALSIADLCHYVADINQPLHCTQNYDGGMTGNNGIHSRYESTMMSPHIADLHTSPMATTYYPSAVDAMFDDITASWGDLNTILQADNAAKAAAGGSTSGTTYYASLWTGTETMTRSRIDTATLHTASLVYTAWMNAGQPAVPGSSASVAPLAVAGLRLDAGPTPFRDQLTVRYAGEGPLRVDVFDVRGTRVARLVDGASGTGSVAWGRTSSGRAIVPGLYFIRLSSPGTSVVRRVTLLD